MLATLTYSPELPYKRLLSVNISVFGPGNNPHRPENAVADILHPLEKVLLETDFIWTFLASNEGYLTVNEHDRKLYSVCFLISPARLSLSLIFFQALCCHIVQVTCSISIAFNKFRMASCAAC